jgi:Tyrosine phosphatase family
MKLRTLIAVIAPLCLCAPLCPTVLAQHAPESAAGLMHLEGTRSTRDIGGYPAADRKHVVPGWTFCSSGLSYLTGVDVQKLKALKVQIVVDFRSLKEAAHACDRLLAGTSYVNTSIIADKLTWRKCLQS